MERLGARLPTDKLNEANKLATAIDTQKAAKIFFQNKVEAEEVRTNENIEMNAKEERYVEHFTYMYASLKVMKKESIAGTYKEAIIKSTKRRTRDKRGREQMSPDNQAAKSVRKNN